MRLRTVFLGYMQRCAVLVQCVGWTVNIIRCHYVCMHTREFTAATTITSMLMPKNMGVGPKPSRIRRVLMLISYIIRGGKHVARGEENREDESRIPIQYILGF
jgi:hypothetical protein